MANFGDFQVGIYLEGMMNDQTPAITTNLARIEDQAREVLEPEAMGYIVPSAGDGASLRSRRLSEAGPQPFTRVNCPTLVMPRRKKSAQPVK